MKSRIFTGVLLFVIFVAIAFFDIFWLNFILFGVVLALAFLESLKLFEIEDKNLVIIALAFYAILPFITGINDIFKIILLNITLVTSVLIYKKSENLRYILPFLYPTIPAFMIFALYQNYGMNYLFWLIFTVIASDSGAYFVGKAVGKHGFSPSSPNKTLEGVLGGVVAGGILGSLFALIFVDMGFALILGSSLLVAVFGVFGDLFESYLKRQVGLKDSGALLGEHGGVLDRIDGYLFGVIAMFLVIV